MYHDPYNPLFHFDPDDSGFAQNHAQKTASPFALAQLATQKPQHIPKGKMRFHLKNAHAEDASIAAIVLEQAIENIATSLQVPNAVTVLRETKDARPEKYKANDALHHQIANKRIRTGADEAECFAREALQLNDSNEMPGSRSWKRVLTQRNDALHHSRTDISALLAQYPDILPTEMEKLVSLCRVGAKASLNTHYDEKSQALEIKSLGIPTEEVCARLADELSNLHQRMTHAIYADQDVVQISLNKPEAQLFQHIAEHLHLRSKHEHARIVVSDPNPLELITMPKADFQQLQATLTLPQSRAR